MKKILFILAICLFATSANAQKNGIPVDKRIYLTGEQWHYDNFSILEANNDYYMVISPKEYYYEKLEPMDREAFNTVVNDTILDCYPYVLKNSLGWYIRGKYLCYFYSRKGNLTVLHPQPLKYNYRYYVCLKLFIDLSRWHWYTPSKPLRQPPRMKKGCKIDLPEYKQLIYPNPPYYRIPKQTWKLNSAH